MGFSLGFKGLNRYRMLKFSKLQVCTVTLRRFFTSRPGMIRFMFPMEHEASLSCLSMNRGLYIGPNADHYWWSFKQSVLMAAVTHCFSCT
jgi:hypothetical protein